MYYPLVDVGSVRVVGSDVTFWLRKQPEFPIMFAINEDLFERFSKVDDFEYILLRITADCFNQTIRGRYMSTRSRDGTVLVESASDQTGKNVDVEPESFSEELLRFVCSRMSGS